MPLNFQMSLDLVNLEEAVQLARLGVQAGVNTIEAGTILILSEGAKSALNRLRTEFPNHPLVADVKCTDGVGPEFGLMFDCGADFATVMANASDAAIREAVRAAKSRVGKGVMVDTMGAGGPDGRTLDGHVAAARRARDLGADVVVLHLGFDERNADRTMVTDDLLLRWAERVVAADLGIPLQVVGGLTLAQATALPSLGISDIVISMNLGAAPVGKLDYDKLTGFSVDLDNPQDRERVVHQVHEFIETVSTRAVPA